MSFICSKCSRECKDQRGLTHHERKCGIEKEEKRFICEYCNDELRSNDSLKKHVAICPRLKELIRQKEEEEKELQHQREVLLLKKELDAQRVEYEKRLHEQQADYNKQLNQIQLDYTKQLNQSQKEFDQIQIDYTKQLSQAQKEFDLRLHSQVSMRDSDYKNLYSQHQTLIETSKKLEAEKDRLFKMLHDSQQHTSIYAHRAAQQNYTNNPPIQYIQNIKNNTNTTNYIIQTFDPTAFQGKINPPDVMVSSIQQFANLIFDKGFGNYIRITDRSRNTGMWNKPGKGVIKDPQCGQITDAIIDSMYPDLLKQKSWLEDQLNIIKKEESTTEAQVTNLEIQLEFTKSMIHKYDRVVKELQKIIGTRARSKDDTHVDKIKEASYLTFSNHLFDSFVRTVKSWLGKSILEIGKIIGKDLHEHYAVEGGSFNEDNPFILVTRDDDRLKIVSEELFEKIWIDMIEREIASETIKLLLTYLLDIIKETNKHTIPLVELIREPTTSKHILHGLIKARR